MAGGWGVREGELKLTGVWGSEGGVNWSWQEAGSVMDWTLELAGGLHTFHLKPTS